MVLSKFDVESAIVLSSPLQKFLNKAFAAETATEKFLNVLTRTPINASIIPPGLEELERNSSSRVLNFISGRQGMEVLEDIAKLFTSFSDGHWTDLRLTSDEKYKSCLSLLCAAGDAYFRLVFRYQQSKFELLEAADKGIH